MVSTSAQRARSTGPTTPISTNPNSQKPSSYIEGQSCKRNFWYVEVIRSSGPHLVGRILGVFMENMIDLAQSTAFGQIFHREGTQNGSRDVWRGWGWDIEKKFFWKRPDLGQKGSIYVSEFEINNKTDPCMQYFVHYQSKSKPIELSKEKKCTLEWQKQICLRRTGSW